LIEIDELQSHGINSSDISKLKSNGICTIKAVQMTTKRNLCKIKGLAELKVDKIKEAASKILVNSLTMVQSQLTF
ncbi:hypothetical protein K502DRAFT_294484, partial [Neoconidiobolus thromboides FSU 785]